MDPTTINPTLKRKVQKALQTSITDPELVLALRNLSTFYHSNSSNSRWNLRDHLENRSLEINKEVLEAFLKIDAELESLKEDFDSMKEICDSMSERVQHTKTSSGLAIQQAESLFNAEKTTEVQLAVAETFLAKFSLSNASQRAIKNAEVNLDFFDALKQVHRIHHDCSAYLIASHQFQQRAGTEIVESMNELLELAYRKLYRWVREQARLLDSPHDPEVPNLLVLGFEALQDRPVLLSYCLEEVAQTRAKALVEGFMDALTKGGPSGVPKPIDIHAHDPKRYIGDMAAWIHQTLAAEQDFLKRGILRKVNKSAFIALYQAQGLEISMMNQAHQDEFGDQNDQIEENIERQNLIIQDLYFKATISKLLDIALSTVCRPFKARVDQVLNGSNFHPSPLLLCTLTHMFSYYRLKYNEIVGAESSFIARTFQECQENTRREFFKVLSLQMSSKKSNPPQPSVDLCPPHEFIQTLHMMEDLIKVVEASLLSQTEKENEVAQILDIVVEPLLEAAILGIQKSLTISRPSSKGMPVPGSVPNIDISALPIEHTIYLINCHTAIIKVLEAHSELSRLKISQLKPIIDSRLQKLVADQAAVMLRNCGLAPKLAILHSYRNSKAAISNNQSQQNQVVPASLSLVQNMDTQSLMSTFRTFESSLLDIGTMNVPLIEKLDDDRIRSQARASTASLISDSYALLYHAIHEADSGYDNPDAILRYKPEQIKMILNS